MSDSYEIGRVVYRGVPGLHGLLADMIERDEFEVEVVGALPQERRDGGLPEVVVVTLEADWFVWDASCPAAAASASISSVTSLALT